MFMLTFTVSILGQKTCCVPAAADLSDGCLKCSFGYGQQKKPIVWSTLTPTGPEEDLLIIHSKSIRPLVVMAKSNETYIQNSTTVQISQQTLQAQEQAHNKIIAHLFSALIQKTNIQPHQI